MDREEVKGVQAAVLAYTVWGLLTMYWKELAHLNPFEMIGWRVLSATVIMTIFCAATGRWQAVIEALSDSTMRGRLLGAGALLVGNWTSYVWAVTNDRVIETALGYFLSPLFLMLIGAFKFGEELTPLKQLATVSTVVAVIVLTVSYGSVPYVAILLAVSWSAYGVLKRGVPLGPYVSLTGELYMIAIPAAVAVSVGFFHVGGVMREASGIDWPLLVGTGLITAVPLSLFSFAAPRVPFTLLGPISFLVPIINLVLGWLVYDEPMTTARFIGFGFVWVALLLVTIDTWRAAAHRRELTTARSG